MITKEQLKQRVLQLKASWLDSDFEENLDRIIEADLFDLEKYEDNYHLAHPILSAILERTVEHCIYGFSDESIPWAKRAKNQAKKYVK